MCTYLKNTLFSYTLYSEDRWSATSWFISFCCNFNLNLRILVLPSDESQFVFLLEPQSYLLEVFFFSPQYLVRLLSAFWCDTNK